MAIRLSDIQDSPGESPNKRGIRLSDINDIIPQNTGKRKNIMDVLAGGTPEETMQINFPAGVAQGVGRDLASVPAHYINQLMMNYPRKLTEKAGYEYPSVSSNPVMGAAANIAGVYGAFNSVPIRTVGMLSKVPQVAKILTKIPSLAKQITAGAALGGAYAQEEPQDNLTAAAIGAAVPVVGAGLSRTLSSISKATPQNRLKQMSDATQTLHNAYERGVRYAYEGGKKVEKSNPIQTIIDNKVLPKVNQQGRADTTEIVEKLTDNLDVISGQYKNLLDPNKTVSLNSLWNKVQSKIMSSGDLKSSGQVKPTLTKAQAIFDDLRQSYGDDLSLDAVDDIRMAMNKRFDPELKDAFRAIGDSTRRVIYEEVPQARSLLSKEGEIIAARNFADVMNNKPVKGGRLGNYVGQSLGAIIGSSTNIPVVGPVIGALGGNAASRALQQNYFRGNPAARSAEILDRIGKLGVDEFVDNAQRPLIRKGSIEIRPLTKAEEAKYNLDRFKKRPIPRTKQGREEVLRIAQDENIAGRIPLKSAEGTKNYVNRANRKIVDETSGPIIRGESPLDYIVNRVKIGDLALDTDVDPKLWEQLVARAKQTRADKDFIKQSGYTGDFLPALANNPRKKLTNKEIKQLLNMKPKGKILRQSENAPRVIPRAIIEK